MKLNLNDSINFLKEKLANYKQVTRDDSLIQSEYNYCKYGKLLELDSILACKNKEINGIGEEIVFSIFDYIYRDKTEQAFWEMDKIVHNILVKYCSPNYCELGCGYGHNLTLVPNHSKANGGEYTVNGIKLACKFGLDVEYFNYYDTESYKIIKPESTVFTVHSIEQLPSAQQFIQNIRKFKENIRWVVHIEPYYIPNRGGPFGWLRNQYAIRNDYNRDLEWQLLNAHDIEVVHLQHDVIGLNPLNSSHCICWRFC